LNVKVNFINYSFLFLTKNLESENLGIKYLKIPIEDNEKNLISSHFERVFLFIEEALNPSQIYLRPEESKNNSIKDDCSYMKNLEIDYENDEIQILISEFAKSYDLNFGKNSDEKITALNIDKIQDLHIKNKICQILIKHHYTNKGDKSRILIHCSLGVSRSPSLAIMYLMKKMKLSFESVIFKIVIK